MDLAMNLRGKRGGAGMHASAGHEQPTLGSHGGLDTLRHSEEASEGVDLFLHDSHQIAASAAQHH